MDDDSLIRRRDTSGGKSRHLFHRRSDQQRHSLLEQSVRFTFHLIAIAVRRPCLQLVETDRVNASSDVVPNFFVAAEILAPGDYCRFKIMAAMDRTLCDQLFQLRMRLGRPFRGLLSTVPAPLYGLYCECDMGSCEPDQRLIAALCKGGIEHRYTTPSFTSCSVCASMTNRSAKWARSPVGPT